ncbi:uncharacterized protein LOC141909910 [Tubulanus polymorphus]|uniref:uncharacterized protein LOC141909910 n=1 Tax=Tubulanus polymorphus TaxID=672921 RepID=UPI003DA59A93
MNKVGMSNYVISLNPWQPKRNWLSRLDNRSKPTVRQKRLKWRIAIKRLHSETKKIWEPGKWSGVCSKHFTFRETPKSNTARAPRAKKRRKLFADADITNVGREVVYPEQPEPESEIQADYSVEEERIGVDVDQLFLTLIKLRQAKENIELSFMFNISESTAGSIIDLWIRFMYYQFKELDIWPSKDNIVNYMPKNFGKQFGKTRVILDATEIPIAKPSNVTAQSATFSTYKNKKTLKTMIGITPHGMVSYISDSYGGSSSDRQIIERSPLVTEKNNYFARGDSIMSDHGIIIQDLFDTFAVKVNTPHMLKGKSQLDPEDVVYDRRIASKRIHVERVIGLAKTYKILERPLGPYKTQMGSFIKYICCVLVNFRPSIVDREA